MAEDKSTTNVILDAPETWFRWIAAVKGMVPEDLWEYFDPNEEVAYEKPSPFTFADVRPGVHRGRRFVIESHLDKKRLKGCRSWI